MLQDHILVVIGLLFGIAVLTMLSNKLNVSHPILLVISGLLVSVIPGIPSISLQPDLVFLIFLPPLLYAAAWNSSWHDFRKNKRSISLLAFGLVIFTSTAVAIVSGLIIPGFSLADGFLLGGIISPPDAVAATSIFKGLRIPKRLVTILEGESLINDASSLIIFRFALAAILTGQFYFWDAAKSFFVVVIMGLLIGLAIAGLIYVLHRFFPTTTRIDAAITLISPYLMYISAEHFHYSGVLAVVSGGLFLSFRAQEILTYESRLYAMGVWRTLIFLMNGLVFILIGLQLPVIINSLGNYSVADAIFYSVAISLTAVVVRIIWVFPGAYLPRILVKSIRISEPRPSWQQILLIGWSGMRGVVSLASALAIPIFLSNGERFQQRNLILFITFGVILFTLVLQGLSIKSLIKYLKIEEKERDTGQLEPKEIRIRLAGSVLTYLNTNYAELIEKNETYKRVYDRYKRMIELAKRKLESREQNESDLFLSGYRQMLVELVHIRRRELNDMRHKDEYSEELIREWELELDLEEARLRT